MIVRSPDANNMLSLEPRNDFHEGDGMSDLGLANVAPSVTENDYRTLDGNDSSMRFDQELERAEAREPVQSDNRSTPNDDAKERVSEMAEKVSAREVRQSDSPKAMAGNRNAAPPSAEKLAARAAQAAKRASMSQALLQLISGATKPKLTNAHARKVTGKTNADIAGRHIKTTRQNTDGRRTSGARSENAYESVSRANEKTASKAKSKDVVANTMKKAAENIGRNLAPMSRMSDPKQVFQAAKVITESAKDTKPTVETDTAKLESTLKTVLSDLSSSKTTPQTATQKVQATQVVRDTQQIHQRIMDHIDTLQLSKTGRETQMTVKLGELGDVKMNVRMAQQVGQTGQLQVVLQANDPSAASMLKDSIAQLAETLDVKGYKNSTVEVQDTSSSETDTRRHRQGQHDGNPNQQWSEAEDNEALAAARGRQYRDNQESSETKKGMTNGN